MDFNQRVDELLKVLHKLGVDYAESLREADTIDIDGIYNLIMTRAKIAVASDETIVNEYQSVGRYQVREQVMSAARQYIGLSEDEMKNLEIPELIRKINDKAKAQSTQDAKSWDLERMKLLNEIDTLKTKIIPEMQRQHLTEVANMRKDSWIYNHLAGKELTHPHYVVKTALLEHLNTKFLVRFNEETNDFEILNKNGTKLLNDKQTTYLTQDEIILRELEAINFLRQQNVNSQNSRQINVVGAPHFSGSVSPQPGSSNSSQIGAGDSYAGTKGRMTQSQRVAAEANRKRANAMLTQPKN